MTIKMTRVDRTRPRPVISERKLWDHREIAKLVKVGFWKPTDDRYASPEDKLFPKVETMVDPSWDPKERQIVLDHVKNGDNCAQYRGWSDCRVCGTRNGSCDLTDGFYVWPEGFAHYIEEHSVRPPQDFIDHCLRVAQK